MIFVRHALPGERVHGRRSPTTATTGSGGPTRSRSSSPSPDRVEPPLPDRRPGLCGGCDFQHATLPAQRRLKTAVVAEQLRGWPGSTWTGEVAEVSTPETADGLHWRTRMRYVTDAGAAGVGLRAHRSHRVVPLPPGGCRIAAPGALTGDEGVVTETAAGRRWAVAAAGFWQVHPAAADTLVRAVLDGLRPEAGERALDLYCRGRAVRRRAGRRRLPGLGRGGQPVGRPAGRAEPRRRRRPGDRPRRPGRAGAAHRCRTGSTWWCWTRRGPGPAGRSCRPWPPGGRGRSPTWPAIPAALARDLATAAGLGYEPSAITAYDLFPMTHHVECVAVLTPGSLRRRRPAGRARPEEARTNPGMRQQRSGARALRASTSRPPDILMSRYFSPTRRRVP